MRHLKTNFSIKREALVPTLAFSGHQKRDLKGLNLDVDLIRQKRHVARTVSSAGVRGADGRIVQFYAVKLTRPADPVNVGVSIRNLHFKSRAPYPAAARPQLDEINRRVASPRLRVSCTPGGCRETLATPR